MTTDDAKNQDPKVDPYEEERLLRMKQLRQAVVFARKEDARRDAYRILQREDQESLIRHRKKIAAISDEFNVICGRVATALEKIADGGTNGK